MNAYGKRLGRRARFLFSVGGRSVAPEATAEQLGLEDGDFIDAIAEQSGSRSVRLSVTAECKEFHGGRECVVLICEVGDGTFDVSLLSIGGGSLGGKRASSGRHTDDDNLDNYIVNFCLQDFIRIHGKEIATNQHAISCLRRQCLLARQTLSSAWWATIVADSLHDSIDYY